MLASSTFERISVASDGTQGNEGSAEPSISPDGRFVAFASNATNLVPGDTNPSFKIFVHDRMTGLTTRESGFSSGIGSGEPVGGSYQPSISADGRFVAFISFALSLSQVRVQQVYARDRLLGVTILVSAANGVPGNNISDAPSISADGRFVTFTSSASNLVASETLQGVFTRDLITGSITRDSVASNGRARGGYGASLSDDGRHVAFLSDCDLVVNAPGGVCVYVHDRVTGQTTLESGDVPQIYTDIDATISGDGHVVAFARSATPNQRKEVYLRDRLMAQTVRIPATLPATFHPISLKLSFDGRYLVFQDGSSLKSYDRLTAQLTILSVVSGIPNEFDIAANAVAFSSYAALVPEDTNGASDVYVLAASLSLGAPGPPTDLTASSSGSAVSLVWSPPVTGAAVFSYIVEAGSRTGAADLANFNTASAATTFSAAGVGAGTYYVRVRAANALSTSAPSNEAVVTVGSNCAGPGPPSNLSAAIFGTTVTLTWAPGTGATSYRLLVGSSPGLNDVVVSDLGSPATTGTATNVRAGTYFVRVQSLNPCGQSGVSNEAVVSVR
jgi:Tol biopolymer transport system component